MYTLENIKRAFWETFHDAGEVYFGLTDKYTKDTDKYIEVWWKEFVEYLKKEKEGLVEDGIDNKERSASIIFVDGVLVTKDRTIAQIVEEKLSEQKKSL